MRTFTDKEVFERGKLVTSLGAKRSVGLPLIVGIQSLADAYDEFDDKFFLYDENDKFIIGTTGTTNSGATGLKDFMNWNPKGCWVWQTDRFYSGFYEYGLHKGRMNALRQIKAAYGFRDNNKNDKSEQIGKLYFDNVNANFHGVDYDPNSIKVIKKIGGWSTACNVCNNMVDYKKIIKFVKPYVYCDYLLLKEWK